MPMPHQDGSRSPDIFYFSRGSFHSREPFLLLSHLNFLSSATYNYANDLHIMRLTGVQLVSEKALFPAFRHVSLCSLSTLPMSRLQR
jgi:hypothetical protein